MLIETDYLNYPPIRKNLTSATPRTTSCFDDRLLTMMTDTGFYVPWRVGYNFRSAKLLEKPSGTLWWMSTLVSIARSYRNELTLYLSQIKPHLIIISEIFREKSQKLLSVQVVRLSIRDCYLHLYTIKLLSFSYISAKFEATVRFHKVIGAHQRWQVEQKWLPLSTDQFWSGCLWWQLMNFSGKHWWQVLSHSNQINTLWRSKKRVPQSTDKTQDFTEKCICPFVI